MASGGLGLLLCSAPPFCDCHKESSMASTDEQGEEQMMEGEQGEEQLMEGEQGEDAGET